MIESGKSLLSQAVALNKRFREGIINLDYVYIANFQSQDPTKTVFRVSGVKGPKLYELLDDARINVEKYTKRAVLVSIHINITDQDVDTLIEAVKLISKGHGCIEDIRDPKIIAE